MDETISYTPQTSVAEILARWPQVIPVFIKHGMACVGCGMSTFETLADALRIYRIDPNSFYAELEHFITNNSR